jgi:hypothetical protein
MVGGAEREGPADESVDWRGVSGNSQAAQLEEVPLVFPAGQPPDNLVRVVADRPRIPWARWANLLVVAVCCFVAGVMAGTISASWDRQGQVHQEAIPAGYLPCTLAPNFDRHPEPQQQPQQQQQSPPSSANPTGVPGGPSHPHHAGATGACYPPEFGPPPDEYSGIRAQHCERAVEWFGNEQRLQAFASKVLRRECVHVVFFGGSVTCGYGIEGPTEKRWLAYPDIFTKLLNLRLPCDGGQHTFDNLCRGATTSSEAWEKIHSEAAQPSINKSSFVFVEKGINDWDTDGVTVRTPGLARASDIAEYWTEAISRAMIRLFPHVHVVWLELFGPVDDPPYLISSVHVHRRVVEYYDFTMLSMARVLGPFSDKARVDWLRRAWYTPGFDLRHPGAQGHTFIAGAMMLYVERLIAKANSTDGLQTWLLPPTQRLGDLPKPLAVSLEEATFMDAKSLLKLDLSTASEETKALLTSPGDWSFATDIPRKPISLMTTKAGGSCAELSIGNIGKVSTVVLDVLKSYEHFGTLLVELLEPADCAQVPIPAHASAWAPPLISDRVNCKWDRHSSQIVRYTSRDLEARAKRRLGCPLVLKLCNGSPIWDDASAKLKVFSVEFY